MNKIKQNIYTVLFIKNSGITNKSIVTGYYCLGKKSREGRSGSFGDDGPVHNHLGYDNNLIVYLSKLTELYI